VGGEKQMDWAIAEERAQGKRRESGSTIRIRSSSRRSERARANSLKELLEASEKLDSNKTPEVAQLVEIDYKLNGGRCRSNTDEFIAPRWVPDLEVTTCSNQSCMIEFDWINRRHHCRYCGKIFCNACSTNKLLLPREYGLRDPQKVCQKCALLLVPLQSSLSIDIANHMRVNTVDIVSGGGCNFRRYFNLPFSMTLGSEIRKAAFTTHNLYSLSWIRDKGIPLHLIMQAKGLAYLSVIKGGFMFAPRFGTGLVIARLSDGSWSAPTAIGTIGLSYGALIGVDMSDYIVILNSDEAVSTFSGLGQISVAAGMEVAIGPVGRSGAAGYNMGDGGLAPAISYSHSRGLYAGFSLDGAIIFSRGDVNHRFYGRAVNPIDLLRGDIVPPKAAQPLYEALEQCLASVPPEISKYTPQLSWKHQ